MNKKSKKVIYFLILLFSLLAVTTIIYINQGNQEERYYFQVSINHKGNKYKINYWNEDEEYYVFLPNYVELENIKLDTDYNIYIDGRSVDNLSFKELNFETDYTIIIKNKKNKLLEENKIRFLKSSNIATMLINTVSGTMENIYEDKNYKEKAEMQLINSNGEVEYNGMLNYIKGRGNSTWLRDKRPFNIQLSKDKNLLNMGKAQNYALIANFIDKTNLRNKIIYDLAEEVNLDYSPNSEYVDLYLNGEYFGIYLLSERLEIAENRIDISTNNENDITGPYLFEKDLIYRYNEETYGFLTNREIPIVIKSPNYISDTQLNYASNLWQNMENAIYNQDDNLFNYIDLDSWVKKYLIEEIFGNFDANNTSMYFYKKPDSKSKLIYAGPVWDYDGAVGNVVNYNKSKEYIVDLEGTYWNALMKNNKFRQKAIEEYNKIFVPKIEEIINNEIDIISQEIYNSTQMDIIRWKKHPINENDFVVCTNYEEYINHLKRFLTERIEFLNEEWNVE